MTYQLGEVVLTSQSDERLVELARAGQERAFAVIVERYRPELHALARRLSADGKGEDIVQQTFLSAFAALRSGAEVRHLRGWLYRIVRNTAARSWVPVCVPLDGAEASRASVEDFVQQRAVALDALAEMARLPRRQRQAMVGTALEGRGRAEVAGSMGVSEGAVRQLVHRARGRLRTVVTAVTPWPLARWLAGARPGTGGPVDVATTAAVGAGAVSSGGVALKLGVVLASGAIATGVAAVDVHGGASRVHRSVSHAAGTRADRARLAGPGSSVAAVAATVAAERSRGSGGAEGAEGPRSGRRRDDGLAAETRRHDGGSGGGGSGGGGSGAGGDRSSGSGRGDGDGGSGSGGGGSGSGGGHGPSGSSGSGGSESGAGSSGRDSSGH
ncbi:MAG: RNA polymerase sigma factor [Solirubrobacteraceae bacterium]